MDHSPQSRITVIQSSPAEGNFKGRRIKSNQRFAWLHRIGGHLSSVILFNQTITIEQFPVSLGVLTSFYRFFGFSFSGCRFVEKSADYQIDNKKFALTNWRYTVKQASKRYLGIIFNIILLSFYMAPFLKIQLNNGKQIRHTYVSGNYTAIRFEDFGHFIWTIAQGITSNEEDLDQLKPILRMIMQWLLYVFMFNGFLSILFNLFFGGSFARHLVSIPEFGDLDRSKSLARRLLCATVLTVLIIKLFSMWMYQTDMFKLFFYSNFGNYDPQFTRVKRQVMLLNFFFELFATTSHYMILSMISVMFIYAMVMFKRSIEHLQNDVTRATDLDELQLTMLKDRLYLLNESFKSAVSYFSVPITLDLVANCYQLIGSACFLIINQNKGIRPYAIAFIANIGLYALVRMVVVASAGNFATNACNTLVRLVYEAKAEWTLQEWLAYLDIKRAPAEFSVSIFSIFSVQQSSILTMLGFALNYIVILLQTENYGSQSQNGTNITTT